MLHQADILLGYLQLLDQRLVDGKRCFAEKALGGGGGEVRKHMDYEDMNVFTYVENLMTGLRPSVVLV